MEHHVYFVDVPFQGRRLDAFLVSHLPAHSRSHLKGLIESGHITVDGAPAKPALRVRRGQRIEITIPPPPPAEIAAEALPLDVIFEDDQLLVVNKPPGLVVHPGAGRPGGTLANAVLARVPQMAGVGSALRPGIVHRLDKDTSGLLMVAKTPTAYRVLQSQVAARTVSRTYLALVNGVLGRDEGTIDAPIGRHPHHRTRMAVVPRGRAAVTRYRVRKRFADHTLVEVQLVTGRTHQIRVHFAHLGYPVAGDPVYGRADDLGVGRQALHAFRLKFTHPTSGRALEFEAPLPADLSAGIARARAEGLSSSRRKGTPQHRTGERDSRRSKLR
ncbi:MAG TPA: RluA family pseudouridine synthase [bacterium]|nr:RluA family pseudouridine synthase [bacterium]